MGGSSPKQNTSSIAQEGSSPPLGLDVFSQGMEQLTQRGNQQRETGNVPPIDDSIRTTQYRSPQYDPVNTGIGPSEDFLSARKGYLNANPQKPLGGK